MCSLVMSLCSCDVIKYYYNRLNSSGLGVTHSAWFLDGKTSTCYTCVQYRDFRKPWLRF